MTVPARTKAPRIWPNLTCPGGMCPAGSRPDSFQYIMHKYHNSENCRFCQKMPNAVTNKFKKPIAEVEEIIVRGWNFDYGIFSFMKHFFLYG